MHKQHPQTAYRKYAVLIGTISENCDKSRKTPDAQTQCSPWKWGALRFLLQEWEGSGWFDRNERCQRIYSCSIAVGGNGAAGGNGGWSECS